MPHFRDSDDLLEPARLPLMFWLTLLFQARSWWVLIFALASGQQARSLLELFYPEAQQLSLGLVAGLFALAMMALSGYRQRWPAFWSWGYWLVLMAGGVNVIWAASQLDIQALEASPLPLLILLFELLSLGWWLGAGRH